MSDYAAWFNFCSFRVPLGRAKASSDSGRLPGASCPFRAAPRQKKWNPALNHATTGYRVSYRCCCCGAEWQSQWSCACDDECSECGATNEAHDYELDGTCTEAELDAYNGASG